MVCPQQHDRRNYDIYMGRDGTDLNVQNDYDGDGKTEFAVWRNTDGKFYIFNPANKNISVVSWGVPTTFLSRATTRIRLRAFGRYSKG